jgi:hypothetical protein
MLVTHSTDLVVKVPSYYRQWVERDKAALQKLNDRVRKRLSASKHCPASVCLLLCVAAQCLIPTLLSATALAEDAAVPQHGSDSVKGAQSGWVVSPVPYRSQPEQGMRISRLEPEVAIGTAANPRIVSASFPGREIEPSMSSRTDEVRRNTEPTSPDPVTALQRNTTRYSLLSWPRGGSVVHSETEEVNGGIATFGSGVMTIPDKRTPADGLGTQFRPLLEIHLGAYKLLFLDAPNAQADWPSW